MITDRSPVEGLSRRSIPFLPVFAQAVAAVAPAGAMAVIPALVLGVTGANLFVAFAIAMGIMLLVAACLNPMARRMAAVSGLYSYTALGLGPRAAITAGWSSIFGYTLIAMASLLAVGTYLVDFANHLGINLPDYWMIPAAVMLVTAVAATLLTVRGILISTGATLLIECVSIGIMATLVIMHVVSNGFSAMEISTFAKGSNWSTLPLGIVVAVSAFVGFESPTTLGGETNRPFVNVPRAVIWTPVATGVLYLLAAAAQGMVPITTAGNPPSPTPLLTLLSSSSTIMALAVDFGIAASFFACSIASINALARILFCMGREGSAPKTLGTAHSRFQTPWTAILLAVLTTAVVPIVMLAARVDAHEGLTALLTLGAFGHLGAYILASISMPLFLRRIGEGTVSEWVLGTTTSLAIVVTTILTVVFSLQNGNFQVLIYAAVVLTSVLYAYLLRRFAPRRLTNVGIYDETRHSDLLIGRRSNP